MAFDEYESLPTKNIKIHMIAGAIAGILEHCLMYPIDSVKTRMQSLVPSPDASYTSLRDGLTKMITNEGFTRTLRGVNVVIVGAGPAHAMYFSAYEGIKAKFKSKNKFQNDFTNAAAGCGATLLHDAIMVPSEVVKQRMQIYNSPYRSCLDCMCKLYCREGIRAFYRSYSTQVLMNIPFHVTHVVMYERISDSINPSREYNYKVHLLAGACAGGLAAAFTTPLDMCKTLLNTQEASTLIRLNQTQVVGLISAFKTIYALRGYKGYFRGLSARVLYQMPGTAISWSIYELFKHLLIPSNHPPEEDDDYDGATTKPMAIFASQKIYADSSSSSLLSESHSTVPCFPRSV